MQHRYDAVIVGAGGAGMRAALEAGPRVRTAVLTKLYPTRSPHRRGAGRHVRRARERRGGQLGVAHLRHGQGRRLPGRPGRRRDPGKEAIDAVLDLEKMGLPFNRTPEGRIDQRRFGGHTRNHGEAAGAPLLLRRRPHRPHDPADAVPELRQAGRRVLQRVLRPRPAADRDRRAARSPPASSPTSWPPARSTSSRPRRSSSPPAASARSSRPRPTRTP